MHSQSVISNLKSQISNLKSQISNLKSQISNLKSQISNLKSQISNLKPYLWLIDKHKPISEELQQKLDKSRSNQKALKKQKQKLTRVKPKELDNAFHELHEEVFEEVDCLECANCCKTTSPIFRDKDIERLAAHFRIKASDFVQKYLHLDDENDYVLNSSPCPFLGDDLYCSVYESRPKACREYPHTDRKNMSQILNLTLKNTKVCPAVGEIMQRLKSVIE